jgi:hypothetical protein
VFHYPINAGTEINATGALGAVAINDAGSGYTNGTYTFIDVTGGSGSGATITVTVAGGIVTAVTINDRGTGYAEDDLLSATIPGGSGFELTVTFLQNYVSLWQHEIGYDAIQGGTSLAIESYFETNDLGWISGGPSQPSPVGDNNWLRLERVEPDFIMTGQMELYIVGRPYAQADDETTGPYVFDASTHKIDMKEQRRELRLRFVSNDLNGTYQTGRIVVNADLGDVRGY